MQTCRVQRGILAVSLLVCTAAPALAAAQAIQDPNHCPDLSLTSHVGRTDADSNGEVRKLQEFLSAYGTSSPVRIVTGYFGKMTEARVMEFQRQQNLPETGVVDAPTRSAIAGVCAGNASGTATAPLPAATVDQDPFTSLSVTPAISGSASNLGGPLRVIVVPDDSIGMEKNVYENDAVRVANGRWSLTIAPELPEGEYRLKVYSGKTLLTESALVIGLTSLPAIVPDISLPPFDVADGRLMRFGVTADASGPVSIGQFTFALATTTADVSSINMYGYTDASYVQPISTSTNGMINASAIDPSASTFSITPLTPVEIPAGQTYFFEVDGTVTPSDTQYSVETTLLGDSTATTTGTLDQLTAQSNFVWSPNTYDIASTTSPDWTNGDVVPGLPERGISEVRSGAPSALPPACALAADSDMVAPNQPVTISWTSTDATCSVWNDGTKDAPRGEKTLSGASAAGTFILTFYGPHGTTACSTTVVRGSPASAGAPAPASTPPPAATASAAIAPPTSASAPSPSTLPADWFSASPTSGTAPLTVAFKGIVNNSASCVALTYTLSYGDTGTSKITVPLKLCKSQAFTILHSYGKSGKYTASLYKGVFSATSSSSAQLIQSQLISVSTTTLAKNAQIDADALGNSANAFSAVRHWDFASLIRGLFHVLGR